MWHTLLLSSFLICLTGAGASGGVRFAARARGAGAVGVRGQLAALDCFVFDLGHHTVAWVRSRDLQILSHGDVVFTADSRVSASGGELPASGRGDGSDGSSAGDGGVGGRLTRHRLSIASLRDSDAGRYECQVNTEPKMSQFFHLTVLDEEVAEAVAEAAAEWAAERQPRAQSVTEAMQRDEGASGGAGRGAARTVGRAAPLLTLALLLHRVAS